MALQVQNIIKSLESLKDEKRAKMAKTYYPTAMKVIGVTVPNEKKVLKEIKELTKKYTGEKKLELVKELINTGIFECQHLALEFTGKDKKILEILTEKDIDDMTVNMDNWISVDSFAAYIVGYAWRVGKITIDKIKSYLRSDDLWIRRIAVVATIGLNQKARGGTGDAKQTLEICELVIDDHQDMINKALSWALRELSKVTKKPVEEFIENYKDRLHRRVLREVTCKLEKGTKN
jgi:3-methyladenine DNA glycosylase AlkD